MRLKDSFILHKAGAESYLVQVGGSDYTGLVRCRGTAGFLLDLLREETCEEKLFEELSRRYDLAGKEEDARRDISEMIATLRKIGAIEE